MKTYAVVAAVVATGLLVAGCTDADEISESTTSPSPAATSSVSPEGPTDEEGRPPLVQRWDGPVTINHGSAEHIPMSMRVTQEPNHPNVTRLRVYSLGSSSCPAVVEAIDVLPDNVIAVSFVEYDGACTADLAPHVDEAPLPDAVDLFSPIHALVERPGRDVLLEVHVPGRGIHQGNTVS